MGRIAPALVLLAAALVGCGGSDEAREPSAPRPIPPGSKAGKAFDEQRAWRDLRAQVSIGPRSSGSPGGAREVGLIVRRLRAAGLGDVRVQRPYENVVARIPGRERGTVIVAAHHDTKDTPGFVGANDGASGVAAVLELARALPPRLPGPSVSLVFFDAEEPRGDLPFDLDGARGSAQFVRYAESGGTGGSPPIEAIRAMVLLDMVGDCDLSIPHEGNSDPGLYNRFVDAAQGLTGSPAPFAGSVAPIGDDHRPFIEAGIPAVDLIDFGFGAGSAPGTWWHTAEDSLEHVCPRSLEAVGAPALVALPRIR